MVARLLMRICFYELSTAGRCCFLPRGGVPTRVFAVSRKQGPAPATVREVFRIHVQHAESSVAAAMAAAKGPMAELVEADGPANGPLGGAPSMPVLTSKTLAGVWEEAAAAVIAALGVLRRKHSPPRRKASAPMLRARVAAKAAMRCTSACKLLFVARGREQTSKRVLAAVLRQGRSLVGELQAWLPLLAQMFRASPTTTGRFLTHGQQCVRQLHTVMQHGKVRGGTGCAVWCSDAACPRETQLVSHPC